MKGTQEKVASILALLAKFWNIREAEREINDKVVSGYMEIVGLFEQIFLFIGQAFNSVTYQRRLNVLNTLTDNGTKVKGILKERSLKLDHIKNPYFFGEKF